MTYHNNPTNQDMEIKRSCSPIRMMCSICGTRRIFVKWNWDEDNDMTTPGEIQRAVDLHGLAKHKHEMDRYTLSVSFYEKFEAKESINNNGINRVDT